MTLSADDLALVSRLVREGIDNAILGGLAVPVKRPGTTLFDIAGGAAGLVLMDGDTNGIQATNITGTSLAATTRVLVEITPAGAVWIVHPLSSSDWQDFTPTLTQSVAVTNTVNYARYTQRGRTITAVVALSVTSAGTANNGINIGLPVTEAAIGGIGVLGIGVVNDASTAEWHVGLAYRQGGSIRLMTTADLSGAGVGFTAAGGPTLANGDTVAYNVTYEAA